jgi:hypothetical protein
MTDLSTMPETPSAVVIDSLNSLLEAEQGSIFRFLGEGSPYLSRATAEIRKPLEEMVVASVRRANELYNCIDSLGGFPSPRALQNEEQYLAYLSLKFLLPKLVNAKKLLITRNESALRAVQEDSPPPDVITMLESHLAEHRADLEMLGKAAADVNRR